MVEGLLATSSNDCPDDTLQIAEHIVGSKANGSETALRHIAIALRVMRDLTARIVDRTVDLDRQPLAQAGKIETVIADRVLAAEFEAAGARFECLP